MSIDRRTGRGDLKKMKLTNKGARRLNETTDHNGGLIYVTLLMNILYLSIPKYKNYVL